MGRFTFEGKASRAPVEHEYEHFKAENDWTAQQVAQYPNRLRAFCSFNPLKPYALGELARCSKDPQLRHGLKLHFGNSDVDLDNSENVAQVKKVFAAANGYHMPIVVHMHTSVDNHRRYGADEARTLLNELLPAAPVDIPILATRDSGCVGNGVGTARRREAGDEERACRGPSEEQRVRSRELRARRARSLPPAEAYTPPAARARALPPRRAGVSPA